MLIIGYRTQVDAAKQLLLKHWNGQDMGPVELFVGFQVERDRKTGTIRLHQRHYAERLLQRFSMSKANPRKLPMTAGTVLRV